MAEEKKEEKMNCHVLTTSRRTDKGRGKNKRLSQWGQTGPVFMCADTGSEEQHLQRSNMIAIHFPENGCITLDINDL